MDEAAAAAITAINSSVSSDSRKSVAGEADVSPWSPDVAADFDSSEPDFFLLNSFNKCHTSFRNRNQTGKLPCFFGGLLSLLLSSISNALIKRGLVASGSITSSMYPLAAAL